MLADDVATFYALRFLLGVAEAGIAMINSIGNLAGFVSPYLVGAIKDATQSTATGMYLLAASLLIGGLLVICGVRTQHPWGQVSK